MRSADYDAAVLFKWRNENIPHPFRTIHMFPFPHATSIIILCARVAPPDMDSIYDNDFWGTQDTQRCVIAMIRINYWP